MEQDQAIRPKKVGIAVKLLYMMLGIGLLRSIMEARMHAQMESPQFVMFVTLVVILTLCFLIHMIGIGRNWARITYLVLFIIGIPFSISPLLQSLSASPFSGLLGITQAAIQIVALFFLFQTSSSEWFRELKARK